MSRLVYKYSDVLLLKELGFPEDWEKLIAFDDEKAGEPERYENAGNSEN